MKNIATMSMRQLLTTVLVSIFANQLFAQHKLTQHFYFDSDSFNVTKQHQAGIDRMAQAIKLNPYVRVRIDGNTDSIGDREYNIALSKKRVVSIQQEIYRMGVKRDRIQLAAKGEDWPIFNNATESGKSKNRRVDVFLLFDQDTCFKDGCAQTCIPKGTFDPYFTNEIEIKFFPVTNVEQMRTNNVSAQTVEGGYLISSGMLRVEATYKGMKVNPQKPVKLRIPAYKMDASFQIYEGASGSGAVNWKQQKMEITRGKGDCAYFEIDGSLFNKWINIDKPRPPGNMICVDNPFAYLELPAIDNDSSKVILDDIILTFPQNAFGSSNFADVQVKSERVNTLCEMLQLRMTSKTSDHLMLDKNQDILSLSGFEHNGIAVTPDMNSFTAYFPSSKNIGDRDFYTAEEGENGELIWANAGKADSTYTITGCSCTFMVKEFSYPTKYINLASVAPPSKDENFQKIIIRKHTLVELYVYNKRNKNLDLILPDEDGHFQVPFEKKLEDVYVIGKFEENNELFLFDSRLSNLRKRWFKNERVVKAKSFRVIDPAKGLKLKSVSCRTKI